mgnify:CR=1 FL=1
MKTVRSPLKPLLPASKLSCTTQHTRVQPLVRCKFRHCAVAHCRFHLIHDLLDLLLCGLLCGYAGGNNLEIACGPRDQTPLENRSDVLVFTSSVLEEDMALTGPLLAHLFVSTANANDTDWVSA